MRTSLYSQVIAWSFSCPYLYLKVIIIITNTFTYRYFFRLGFLDGFAGYSYALISSLYAFVKYEKLREMYLMDKVAERDR